MANGYALLIGAGKNDNSFFQNMYGRTYDSQPVSGFDIDIQNMLEILNISDFNPANIKQLVQDNATTSNVMAELLKFSQRVINDDLFVFYYTGHGDQIPDINNDEPSRFDQVLVLKDDYLVDDELNILFNKFPSSARIVMIVDACHSGTVNQFISINNLMEAMATFGKNIIIPNETKNNISKQPVNYQMIYAGATTDDKLAEGGSDGSKFTNFIKDLYKALGNKIQNITYEVFFNELEKFDFVYREEGNLTQSFKNNYPFQINNQIS